MTKRVRARVARAMAMVMRVAGNEEGEGGKAMVMVTRVAGERTGMLTKSAIVGRRGTNQFRLLEWYLDVLVKHTTEIPPPSALVEGVLLR